MLWLGCLGCDGVESVGAVGFAAQFAVARRLVAHDEAAGGLAVVWSVGSASSQHSGDWGVGVGGGGLFAGLAGGVCLVGCDDVAGLGAEVHGGALLDAVE